MQNKSKDVKVVLLGDSGKYSSQIFLFLKCKFSGVGKSSILIRFVSNEFKANQESTLGAAFMAKMIFYKDQAIKFQVLSYSYYLIQIFLFIFFMFKPFFETKKKIKF